MRDLDQEKILHMKLMIRKILILFQDGSIQSGGSIKIIQNTRFVVKISECELFSAGNSLEINKIPELFFKKRNLVIMKNLNDNKCLLYCLYSKRFKSYYC